MDVILASDESFGKNFDANLHHISVPKGNMSSVCNSIINNLQKVNNPPTVIVSVGSSDICVENITSELSLYLYGEKTKDDLIDDLVKLILHPLQSLLHELKKRGGMLIICALLPTPKIEYSKSTFADILMEAYDRANLDIMRINEMLTGRHYYIDSGLRHRRSKKLIKSFFKDNQIDLNLKGQRKVENSVKRIKSNLSKEL